LIFTALRLGALGPALYSGLQAVVAPSISNFSVLSITASELGSGCSPLGT
jgi:hypothetical protein